MTKHIDIRCTAGPKRLLCKIKANGEEPTYVDNGLLIEFACSDCCRSLRKQGYDVGRVLHRYNIAGELVETQIVQRDELP